MLSLIFMRYRIQYFILIMFISTQVMADITITSSAKQTNLLELYTSEGCSSCPPADRWLSTLKSHDQLWTNLIPVAFHVDYWDYIGWKDSFAKTEYSSRQRQYASQGGVRTVYTPGFLLNGREWRNFFSNKKLSLGNNKEAGILELNINKEQLITKFTPAHIQQDQLTLNIAILGFDIETQVLAGENHGRTLKHNFVVLAYKTVMLDIKDDHYQAQTVLPKLNITAPKTAIIGWINRRGDLHPIQAVGGWL